MSGPWICDIAEQLNAQDRMQIEYKDFYTDAVEETKAIRTPFNVQL